MEGGQEMMLKKGNLLVEHLKNIFTPNIPNDTIVELPPVFARTVVPLRFKIKEIKKAIADLSQAKKAPGILIKQVITK